MERALAEKLIMDMKHLLSEKLELVYNKEASDDYIKKNGLFVWRNFLGVRNDN
jgi:hypothetical protein